jgi:hypothetical protein
MTTIDFPKDTIVVPPVKKEQPVGEREEEEEMVSVATALKMPPPLADRLPPLPAAGVTPMAASPTPKLHLRRSSVAPRFPLSSDVCPSVSSTGASCTPQP